MHLWNSCLVALASLAWQAQVGGIGPRWFRESAVLIVDIGVADLGNWRCYLETALLMLKNRRC